MEAEKETSEDDERMLKDLANSLMKLNHCKEKSCFTQIIPRSQPNNHVSDLLIYLIQFDFHFRFLEHHI